MNEQRLDQYLWAARFFKTRALAQKGIEKNAVRIQGERVHKPSRKIRVGDQLVVNVPHGLFVIEVVGLSLDRHAPSNVSALYRMIEKI